MKTVKADQDLTARLQELREKHGDSVSLENIAEVVQSVMVTMTGDLTANDLGLFSELEALAKYIHEAKADIAALRPDEVKDSYIPTASDELDAIVQATEVATNTIMDATEEIENVMAKLDPAQAEEIGNATMKIYEACGFQDITGQRITKVVKALQNIEEKIDALVSAFGDEIEKVKSTDTDKDASKKDDKKTITDEDLLEGPQLSGEGRSQEEIDALLASFD